MRKYIVADGFIIENRLDGKRQILHEINEDSPEYQAIKAETNNFTENMDFPPTTEERLIAIEDALLMLI